MTKEIAPKDIFNVTIEQLFPPSADQSRLLVGCRREDYCASIIARAVEDCNAQVLNLNVTSHDLEQSEIVVDLRVNHRNTDAIARSLARYGYEVLEAKSADYDNDEMRRRANEVLRYLEI